MWVGLARRRWGLLQPVGVFLIRCVLTLERNWRMITSVLQWIFGALRSLIVRFRFSVAPRLIWSISDSWQTRGSGSALLLIKFLTANALPESRCSASRALRFSRKPALVLASTLCVGPEPPCAPPPPTALLLLPAEPLLLRRWWSEMDS